MKCRMFHRAPVNNLAADTIRAIIACQLRRKNTPPFTPYKASNESIGRKLSLSSGARESVRKAAQRRNGGLFNKAQPECGFEFITRVKGSYDPATGKSESAIYIDNLTPAADWA